MNINNNNKYNKRFIKPGIIMKDRKYYRKNDNHIGKKNIEINIKIIVK